MAVINTILAVMLTASTGHGAPTDRFMPANDALGHYRRVDAVLTHVDRIRRGDAPCPGALLPADAIDEMAKLYALLESAPAAIKPALRGQWHQLYGKAAAKVGQPALDDALKARIAAHFAAGQKSVQMRAQSGEIAHYIAHLPAPEKESLSLVLSALKPDAKEAMARYMRELIPNPHESNSALNALREEERLTLLPQAMASFLYANHSAALRAVDKNLVDPASLRNKKHSDHQIDDAFGLAVRVDSRPSELALGALYFEAHCDKFVSGSHGRPMAVRLCRRAMCLHYPECHDSPEAVESAFLYLRWLYSEFNKTELFIAPKTLGHLVDDVLREAREKNDDSELTRLRWRHHAALIRSLKNQEIPIAFANALEAAGHEDLAALFREGQQQ